MYKVNPNMNNINKLAKVSDFITHMKQRNKANLNNILPDPKQFLFLLQVR